MTYLVNGNGARTRCLSGASISQLVRHMTPVARAILGAELVEGRAVLEPPTAKTAAALCQVNLTYVGAALRLSPEARAAVLAGERPLLQPRRCTPAPIDWTDVDDTVLVAAVKQIGLDRTLEAAVEAERAGA
jgi:hypothetical protein